MNIRKMVITALLTAIAIIIPYVVVFKVMIPPFTATIGAHVPMFISMFLGPFAAVMTGLGSALGFFMAVDPIVGARALMHVFVALAGAYLVKRGKSFTTVVLVTAPLHGLLEVLVVLPFVTFNAYNLLIVTGVGTMLHHGVDGAISYALLKVLDKSRTFNMLRTS